MQRTLKHPWAHVANLKTTNKNFYQEFVDLMQGEFEISMKRELNFFLRFQVKQIIKEGIERYLRNLGWRMQRISEQIKEGIEVWLDLYFILLLIGLTFYLVYVYMLNSNLIQKNLICLL